MTHPSDPQDTLNASKGQVEDTKPNNSVHHCSQSRSERKSIWFHLRRGFNYHISSCVYMLWHTSQCHNQGWRWWQAIEPESSWAQRPAQQKSTNLELKNTYFFKIYNLMSTVRKKENFRPFIKHSQAEPTAFVFSYSAQKTAFSTIPRNMTAAIQNWILRRSFQ